MHLLVIALSGIEALSEDCPASNARDTCQAFRVMLPIAS